MALAIHSWYTVPVAGVILFLLRFYRRHVSFSARSRGLPLPPGPPGLPILGNLREVQAKYPWKVYHELGKTYGDIVYLNVVGQSLLVLNDFKTAVELLDRRSAIYSSRPNSKMVALTGWEWNMGFIPYGQWWRRHRRMFWQHFHPGVIKKHELAQKDSARQLLSNLLRTPGALDQHIRYALGTVILKATYGLEVAPSEDKYIALFEEGIKSVHLIVAGALLEYFPSLSKVPTWVPGTSFIRNVNEARKLTADLRDIPWNDAKKRLDDNQGATSAMAGMLKRMSHLEGDEFFTEVEVAKDVTAVAYAAALDTSLSLLQAFFVAMSLYPDVQQKARAQLDAVVGPNRLPEIRDRESLPYVDAILKETMRWHVIVPLSVPHYTSEDDEYNGYFIPKGTTVMPNIWAILHDPAVYPQPDEFIPERYLNDGKLDMEHKDPTKVMFGFGRRICPGRYFADATAFIFMASVLHTMDISSPVDDTGRPIHVTPQSTEGLVTFIQDCRCTLKPRSETAEVLIRQYG